MGRTTILFRMVALSMVAVLAGCPAGAQSGKGGGGGAVNPDACGKISTNDVGRKIYAFLVASAELDKASFELERSVKTACKKMARELGVSDAGDTREVCKRAAEELEANLQVSVKTETQMVTRYTPPECTTDVDFTAQIVAECEASVAADIAVSCEGSCSGTCSGACDGTCSSGGGGSECAGQCDGTCRGRCEGSCSGYADVDASVECEASAEVRASVETTCTEPKVEVVQEEVTVIDDTRFQMAMAAIDAGMPTILRVGAKAELVAKALVLWAKTLGKLVESSGKLAGQLGDAGVCVGLQLAAAFSAVAQVEARVSVSVEVSAEMSASAGAKPQ